MPLVRIRHTQPNGRVRWLESVIPTDSTDVMVWSTNPANAAVFDLSSVLRKDVLAWFEERAGQGKVELIEEETA
jgi:hypothetical protein